MQSYKRESNLNYIYLAILGSMLFQNLFSQSFYSFTPYFLYIVVFSLAMREMDAGLIKKVDLSKFKIPVLALFIRLNIVVGFYSIRFFISGSYLKKAVYYSQLRQLYRAESLYKKSIEHNYFNPLLHYLLGNVYLEDGDDNNLYQALRYYNNVEYMTGNYLQLYAFKALACGRLGDNDGMNLYFKKMKDNDLYLYKQFKHCIELKD